jgi:CheY-like chemotaxis protein
MQVPEMDGLEAIRMIRDWESEHGSASATIIALTASALD